MRKQAGRDRRVVELVTKLLPVSIFPGEWESTVPGEGFDFLDIRPYRPGDDPRRLHLPSLVGEGKKRIVDRVAQVQVTIYIYANFSQTMERNEELHFFSKAEIRDVLAGLICFSAAKVYSPLAHVAFAGGIEHIFPPVMGDDNAHRIFRWALRQDSFPGSPDMKMTLGHILRFARPRSIVFLVSDFLGDLDFFEELKRVARSVDLVPIIVQSEQEKGMLSLSGAMRFPLQDVESGEVALIRIDKTQQARMQGAWDAHYSRLQKMFRESQAEWIIADSPSVCLPRLQALFAKRRAR